MTVGGRTSGPRQPVNAGPDEIAAADWDAHAGHGGRVLVVEDDAAVRRLVADVLRAAGHRVAVVPNGFAALNFVRHNPSPDLVILDLGLPVLDGQEFLDAWKTAAPAQHVPVVVLTANPELPPFVTSVVNVQGHITKPFDVEQVVALVDNLLARK